MSHSITCAIRLTSAPKGDKLCDAIHTSGISQRTYLELDSRQGPLLCVTLAVLLKDSLQKGGGLIIPLFRVPLSGLNYLPTTPHLDTTLTIKFQPETSGEHSVNTSTDWPRVF